MLTAQSVADFLGEDGNQEIVALAGEHLPFVSAAVHAYTRGRGFNPLTSEPGDDLALVIVAAAARVVVNPAMHRSETVGDYAVNYAGFLGWTLPEQAILNRYRKRAL